MKAVLQQPSFAVWLNRLLGATFIAFSLMLMTLRQSTE
jgi:threonine/homoserine/homoserine lactone efflux protein